MATPVTIRLTRKQAQEILLVAGNGYGDGDFYGCNDEGRHGKPAPGQARGFNAYHAATDAIEVALYGRRRGKR